MRTEYMEYIVEIADQGSINKASNTLNFAPQKLSRILSVVENEYGYKIFDRTTKGVFITKEGADFLENARNVISIMKNMFPAETGTLGKATDIVSEVEISHIHSTPVGYFLPAIMKFIEKFPSVNLQFNETSYSNIISRVQNNKKLTIGIVAYIYPLESYEALYSNILANLSFIPIMKTRPVALFSENHPFYNRYQKISLKTLMQYPVTILQSNGSIEDSITYKLLKNYGEPKIKYAVTNLEMYYQILKQGNSFGIAAEKNVRVNELKKLELIETIGYMLGFVINKKNENNILVKELLEIIRKEIYKR